MREVVETDFYNNVSLQRVLKLDREKFQGLYFILGNSTNTRLSKALNS